MVDAMMRSPLDDTFALSLIPLGHQEVGLLAPRPLWLLAGCIEAEDAMASALFMALPPLSSPVIFLCCCGSSSSVCSLDSASPKPCTL